MLGIKAETLHILSKPYLWATPAHKLMDRLKQTYSTNSHGILSGYKKAKVCYCASMVEVEVITLSEISLPQINSTHDSIMNSEIDESSNSGQSDAG